MPVYEALAHDLRSRGHTDVFGLMSDDTAMFVATLDAIGVRFHAARHENTAIGMAEGYAAASGRLGVAVIGRGPATANALHGALYAHRTGSRVLLIFGAAPRAAPAGPDSKAFNALGVFEAAGLKTFVAADGDGAPRTLEAAIDSTLRGGCACLLVPADVMVTVAPYPGDKGPPAPEVAPTVVRQPARAAALGAAAAILGRSRRPLFVVGAGAHRSEARAAIEALADRLGAVVATTLKAKDLFQGYPYQVGIVGSFSHAPARRLIAQADCIVAFGASLNPRTTSYGAALPTDVPLIQIDTLPAAIGRTFHADVALLADARTAADQLAQAVGTRAAQDKPFHVPENRQLLADHRWASEFVSQDTTHTMDPRSCAIELDRLLPRERNAVYDAGNFLQIIPFISGPGPGHLKTSMDFASIGMGLGTALGFARGCPQRTTVLFVGDGGLMMTLGDLETAVREDIPLVVVVLNDCAYGAELHFLRLRQMPVAQSQFADVDFAAAARSFGYQAWTVRSAQEVRDLAPVLARPEGPILIDCKINAAVAAPYHTEVLEHARRRH
jgi:acetolactate synthase-1/2/3 large subunit